MSPIRQWFRRDGLVKLAFVAAILLVQRPAAASPPEPAGPDTPDAAEVLIDDTALDLLLGRTALVHRLIRLGDEPARAIAAVSQLTAGDIAVLLENPRMLQRGGTDWRGTWIIAAIIIAIIVAVAASSGGSVLIDV